MFEDRSLRFNFELTLFLNDSQKAVCIRQMTGKTALLFLGIYMTLKDFFEDAKFHNTKIGLAFSGGVDSSYLLYEGVKSGTDITAFYVKSEFQPQFEFDDALRLAKELHANMKVIILSVFKNPDTIRNDEKRCYYCKRTIFNRILEEAEKEGCSILLEGTNASDDVSDRPGYKALQELKVLSPLRMAGLTKDEIRRLSKEAGLFTWNKPSYACLATRIPTGTPISKEDLETTEKGEALMMEMGFSDFRIRKSGKTAKIQVTENQMEKIIKEKDILIKKLKPLYETITLDLEPRKSND